MTTTVFVLIYLSVVVVAGAVALAVFKRGQSRGSAEDVLASVVIGTFWPVAIVLGLLTVAVIAASRVVGSWIEHRWPSEHRDTEVTR